jgi:hypothetical protein
MCITQQLDGTFYRCLLSPLYPWYSLILNFIDVFGLDDIPINKSVVLKAPTAIVSRPAFPFMPSNVCFIKLDASTFGTYKLRLVIFS